VFLTHRTNREERAMPSLSSLPAVRQVETDRPDLFAFDVVGQVSAADVENFYGLLEAAYALHPSIDVLVRVTDHEGIDWGELSPATVEQGRKHARDHVRRCALVGNAGEMRAIEDFFARPVEVRHFASDREAWEWIGGQPVQADV
jgi:hypothetical protein